MTEPDGPPMIMRRTDSGRCPRCGSDLRYGVKEEASSWKVFFDCSATDCGWESSAGRIHRSEIDHVDEVYDRAESFHDRL